MLDDKKDECKGRAGVLACALKGPTEVGLSPMFSICFARIIINSTRIIIIKVLIIYYILRDVFGYY
jgi:hypothetical protein